MSQPNKDNGELFKEVNSKIESLLVEQFKGIDLRKITQHAASVEDLISSLSVFVRDRFPIVTHRYSLVNQVLQGADKAQTDCRLSALLLGHLLEKTHVFDQLALYHEPSSDLHMGLVCNKDGINYKVHFFNDFPGYHVSKISQSKVDEYTLFTIDAKGIVRCDKHLMVS